MTDTNGTKHLIDVALRFADSLEWDIGDSGHAGVSCDYDLAEELAAAVDAYKEANAIPESEGRAGQKASARLANLVRRPFIP